MAEWLEPVLILLAGIGAGALGAVVGSATLVTFPVLVALGYPPVVATMSNAIGQVPGGVSGWLGYRRELRGQVRRLLQLLPASLLGGVSGSLLLMHLPAGVFKVIVPVLLALALVLVIAGPWLQDWIRRRRAARAATGARSHRILLTVLVFLIGVYGGYFTAAQGVLLIAVLGVLLEESLQRINAVRILLALAVNVVAAGMYTIIAFDRIRWDAAGLIAAGTLVGGWLGGTYGRRLPAPVLRGIIVVVGLIGLWRLLAAPQ